MSLRISNALVLLAALAACSAEPAPSADTSAAAGQAQAGAAASVPCALGGAKSYTAECSVERASRDGKVLLTLRHPDGGFRRLIELDGGQRFAAADGSAEAAVTANGRELEVTLGDDHYLFPAAAAAAPSAPAR